jgi:hypothetical protein
MLRGLTRDTGRAQGPLQLIGPGDHTIQKLALMMAVMILGMSPAHGCSISADPGSQGVRDQAEMMLPPSTWSGDDGKALMTEGIISSTTAKGGPPVEPGGHPIRQVLQQIQLGVEGLVRIRNEVLRIGQGDGDDGKALMTEGIISSTTMSRR